ncbi:MAG: HAD-IA family hydrolase [Fimbriiglobus sp.]
MKAVLFDAVGTVIHPTNGAPGMYVAAAKKYGLDLDETAVLKAFRESYLAEEAIDRANGWLVSEAREVERWRNIVSHSLPGTPPECFDDLYHHFAQPHAWYCPPDLSTTLQTLAARGVVLGLASNYDSRLKTVIAGHPELRMLPHVFISSQVGHRKPSQAFFQHVTQTIEIDPADILFVGDDLENDYHGASKFGMQAVLYDPAGKGPAGLRRIRAFDDLLRPE